MLFPYLCSSTIPSSDAIAASPMSVDTPLDKITSGHSNDQAPQQGAGDKASVNPHDEGEPMRRESDLHITTIQSCSVDPQCKIDDAIARQPEQSNQRIKELEDELDKFRRVCFHITSYALLSLVSHSGQRSKALRYWLSRRRWESTERSLPNSMRSCGSCVSVASNSKRKGLRMCVKFRLLVYRFASPHPSIGRLGIC